MLIYPEYKLSDYLRSKKDLAAKVAAMDAIINQMIDQLAEAAAGAQVTIGNYELDDGQVKIKTGYRSIEDVQAGLTAMERVRNLYSNQLRGRAVVLQDKRTFKGTNGYPY